MVPVNSVLVTGLQLAEGEVPTGRSPRRSGSRSSQPQLGHGALHRHAAAHGDLQVGPVHLVEIGMVGRPLNSVLTAGKLWNFCLDSSLSTAGRSRGLGIRITFPPVRRTASCRP